LAKKNLFPLKAKNEEQKAVLKALFDTDVHLVTIMGAAGSGKTLLATYAGLQQTDLGKYTKVVVSRPIIPLGKEIGFLPGTMEEKLAPWTGPIFDAVETLLRMGTDKKLKVDSLVQMGLLEVEALMYIRGRSIPETFLIIDEAQNLTPHEVKTIVTRASEGTKIVLTGDPDQIDTKGLTRENNGLTYVANRFAGEDLARHFELKECVRSSLAALGVKLL
jgi:PhoH-like ATPase